MTFSYYKRLSFQVLPYLIISISLLWILLWNGYPVFITNDTMGYFYTISDNSLTKLFWPIGYSLLLRSSYVFSFVFPVMVQALACAFLLWRIFYYFFDRSFIVYFFCTVVLLACLTRLPLLVSGLHPDIFTSLLFLSLFLMLFEAKPIYKFFYSVATSVLIMMHVSLLPIAMIFLCLHLIVFRVTKQKLFIIFTSILLPLVIVFTSYAGIQRTSRGAAAYHYFLVGKLAEDGLLFNFLEKYCDEYSYKLCEVRVELQKTSLGAFIWKDTNQWKPDSQNQQQLEMGVILFDIMRFEPYSMVYWAVKNVSKPLYVKLPHYIEGIKESDVQAVKSFSLQKATNFKRTVQYQNFPAYKKIIARIITLDEFTHLVSNLFLLAVLGLFLVRKVSMTIKFKQFYYSFITFVLSNAIVSALGASFLNRYYGRIYWLSFLLAILFIQLYLTQRKAVSKT